METRANYILIGAFALAGFLGILAFFLWFANIQLDRQFAYYDIDFPTVSGLSEASDVRFSGLPVGQVVDVRLSPNRDGRVRVRVEVGADTPIRTDSVATIEAQGVTGVSFVGISAGSPDAPLLQAASPDDIPMIEDGQSVLQSLSEDAPEILAETLEVVRDLRELIGGENQRRVQTILENVERSTESFAQALDDFSEISGTVADFASQIERFNTTLDTLTTDASGVLTAAETTLGSINALSEEARGLLTQGSETLVRVDGAIATAEGYVSDELGPATARLSQSVTEIEARVVELGETATGVLDTYSRVGEAANRRLTEAEQTIAAANEMLASVDGAVASVEAAARRFDGLMAEGGEPLIAELRTATQEATSVIRQVGTAAEEDLPRILDDIRAASETASAVVTAVGEDLSSASGRLDGLSLTASQTLEDARVTFRNANETLAAINAALVTGDRALASAEAAFSGADRVINTEVAGITEQLRQTLATLDETIGTIAAEVPGVTEELRSASRSAESAFAEIERSVAESTPGIRDFAASALPQYGRLAAETRALIDNLDALVEQIRRDPSRFFLDPRAPEYRR